MNLQEQLQGNFYDSIIIEHVKFTHNTHKPSLLSHESHANFGSYEKLSHYIEPNKSGKVIPILSAFEPMLQLSNQFIQLLQLYSQYDILLMGVVGDRKAGKSFFIDKMLNLSGCKGNNFGSIGTPGLYIWSIPYVKDNIRMFLIDMTHIDPSCEAYFVMVALLSLICSSMIYIHQLDAKDTLPQFEEALLKKLNQVYYNNQRVFESSLNGSVLYNMNRLPNSNFTSRVFRHVENDRLENAMKEGYVGKKQDLYEVSFMSKDCINQNYITKVSQVFKSMYNMSHPKIIDGLNFNGNIASKIIKQLVHEFNNSNQIHINQIIEKIMRQLYVSAYNYCLISYHEDLQARFQHEQPMSTDSILQIFKQTRLKALQTFAEYSLDNKLHSEFEKNIYSHIEQKQQLILSINEKKTIDKLQHTLQQIHLTHPNQLQANINRLAKIQSQNKGLSFPIQTKLKQFTQEIYKNNHNYNTLKQIDRLRQEKNNKQLILQSEDNKRKQYLKLEKQSNQLKKKQTQLDKKLANLKIQLEKLINSQQQQQIQKKLSTQLLKINQQRQSNQIIIKKLKSQIQSNIEKEKKAKLLNELREKVKAKQQQVKKMGKNPKDNAIKTNPQRKPIPKPQPVVNNDSKIKVQSPEKKQPKRASQIKKP